MQTLNIMDYLHLYLPVPFMWTEDAIPFKKGETGILEAKDLQYWDEFKKPILRKISGMTEEEQNWLSELAFIDSLLIKSDNNGEIRFYATPKRVLYLLSKHFDLFNLIPEGLAIDATTLKQ